MANGGAPAGPASAVQGFVGDRMKTVTAPVDALNLAVAKATLAVLQFLPKMPAARLYTDLVFQWGHSHPHPPSFGFPIPSFGPILASGCMSVLINGQPAARNGDMGLAVWCGGYFPIFEVMTGSSHVFIGGSRAARQGMDVTYHCLPDPFGGKWGLGKLDIAMAVFGVGMSALGLAAAAEQADAADDRAEKAEVIASESASDDQAAADAASAAAFAAAAGVGTATAAAQLAADAAAIAMGLLMGKDPGVGFPFGMITMGSPNVLIGGFPMPGWMTILKGLGKMLKPLIRRIQLKMPEGRLRQALCAITGHPVEIASGRMFTSKTDFEIDGRVPIKFERIYDTSAVDYEGSLGWGWIHPFEQHLWESKKRNCLVLRNNENRQVRFDKLAVGERQFQPLERTWLERTAEFEFKLFDCKDGLTYRFGRIDQFSEDFSDEKNALRLLDISDRNGNRVELEYSENLLRKIRNGTETHVELFHQTIAGKTRLVEIQQHLKNGQTISLMRFGYNEEAELHTATDRTYQPFIYEYENHLMTRETNRNKLSFYFEYEGAGTFARCIHTWGDGNIYERWLEYLPKSRITKVRDGLGGETIYHYNELDLITKVFDSNGSIVQFEYGESGELLKEVDELGRTKSYDYDEQLNCVKVVQKDGTARQMIFNEFCQPVAITDEAGSVWTREYDAGGNITATVNSLDARREYDYNGFGDITDFRDAAGNEAKFEWTISGQIKSVIRPLGGKMSYSYNERDFLSEIADEFTGLKITYQYDDAGRIKRLAEMNGRNQTISVQRYEYDAQGNLIFYVDALGNRTSYRYAGYDKLAERTDALGFNRQFKYDREERLSEIINERGENYLFEYDLLDRVVEETGFDRAKRFYKYNQAGELVYQKDALNRETFYQRDESGRVTKRLRSDASTVNYVYDECGRIIKAANEDSTTSLIYDAAWQVVSEDQNGQIVRYEYDAEGRRTARILSAGEAETSRIEYHHDAEDNLSFVKIGSDGIIDYDRDRAGRLTGRQMPNGLREQFDYDANGRLNTQAVTGGGGRELVRRGYDWDALGNVVTVSDSLRGERRYSYDAVERLNKVERLIAGENIKLPDTSAGGISKTDLPPDKRIWQADDRAASDFGRISEIEEFQYDGDGNLLERKSNVRGSRNFSYDKGDKLERQDKTQYIYDAVGNLIQKRQANGAAIVYEYDADNQLITVSTETGGKIEFKYDAFGRRIVKLNGSKKTGFVWDGDVLLGESKDSQLVTEYVHEGFIPLAKIKDSQIQTYHTDYLGTPKEVTNQQGEIVWQGVYDEYGNVSETKAQTEQNIRFLGQYEDDETGLFYNRFRYYDPDAGRYINQDPIGLFGDYNLYVYCKNPVNWVDIFGFGGSGGAYMFEFVNGQRYIGKGPSERMQSSINQRTAQTGSTIRGAAHVDTGGNNELGKMVEHRAMVNARFTKGNVPANYLNSHLSGQTAWDDNPHLRAQAIQLADKLKQDLDADIQARARAKTC